MYLSNKFFETIRLFDKARSFYLTAQLNDSWVCGVATVNKMKYKARVSLKKVFVSTRKNKSKVRKSYENRSEILFDLADSMCQLFFGEALLAYEQSDLDQLAKTRKCIGCDFRDGFQHGKLTQSNPWNFRTTG